MQELITVLQEIDDFSAHYTESIVIPWIESKGYHLGNIMNAFRLALVGESKGPHIFDITEVLGKEETIQRLEKAILQLSVTSKQ
jgi:glutamyl-tRNA synthetase